MLPSLILRAAEPAPSIASRNNELHAVLEVSPADFNPFNQLSAGIFTLASQLYASPLRFDRDGKAIPYLAREWSVSADGLRVTLHLVEGARFHDGTPITSEDIAFSLLALREHHPSRALYAPIAGVETPSPGTAVIRLRYPHPALEYMVSLPYCAILPRHVYDDGRPLQGHPAHRKPVGSGPFRWTASEDPQRIVLERFEGFFRPERPRLQRLVFHRGRPYEDNSLLLEHDAIQLLFHLFVGDDAFERIAANPAFQLLPASGREFSFRGSITMNFRHPPLNDVRVRRALAMGYNNEALVKTVSRGRDGLSGQEIPAFSPLYQPVDGQPGFDPKAANVLLDAAGYPRDENGILFSLQLDFPPQSESVDRTTNLIRDAFQRNLGIDLKVHRSGSMREWAIRLLRGEFDLGIWFLYSYREPLLGLHRLFHSPVSDASQLFTNHMGYKNEGLDQLLDAAAREFNLERRRDLYARVQQLLFEDLPAMGQAHVTTYHAHHKDLVGLDDSSWTPFHPFDEVYWRGSRGLESP